MVRAFIFLAVLVVLSMGAIWLANRPGEVVINGFGYNIETTFAFLLTLLVLGLAAMFACVSVVRRILFAPRRMAGYLQEQQQKRGILAITEAFAALAMADTNAAGKHIKHAEKMLGSSPLTLMLAAQRSRIEGDDAYTVKTLEQMLDYKETAFLAAKGLADYARSHDDTRQALTYAEKANSLAPDNRWSALVLIDLYSREARWQEAEIIIDRAYKKNTITGDERRDFIGLIYYAQAKRLADEEQHTSALRFAEQAHAKLNAFVPAAVLLSGLQQQAGKIDAAMKTIQSTWKHMPHPDLASIYLNLINDKNPQKTIKAAEKLAATRPDHIESQILIARAAMIEKEWDVARNQIKTALSKQKTGRLCRMMADIEQGQFDDKAAAAEWLLRAASADTDEGWLCSECHASQAQWQTHCSSCGSFNTVSWKTPELRYLPAA